MSESITIDKSFSKEEKYKQLVPQVRSLVEGEPDLIANLANICGALKYSMDGFFWLGFYFIKGDELVIGPYQGPVPCTRIHISKGVCGAAVREKRTIIVEDVDKFPGHIACSSESKSEIVLPVWKNDKIIGVLDADSDSYAMFDDTDAKYLEEICKIVSGLV